jgi:thiamine-phosphate pyrophosphorylase
MKKGFDPGLYLVTDSKLSYPRTICDIVQSAVKGGVSVVQLREKDCSTREYIELGRYICKMLKPLGIPLIINDRIDIAYAVGAQGVHIGQGDIPYYYARNLLGTDAIIGLSVETMEQAIEANDMDIDYLGVSPIFSTPTKTDTNTEWGIEGLRQLRRKTKHTLIAIGGINLTNAQTALEAGADGIAVVSAICSASDPETAAKELRTTIDNFRRKIKR